MVGQGRGRVVGQVKACGFLGELGVGLRGHRLFFRGKRVVAGGVGRVVVDHIPVLGRVLSLGGVAIRTFVELVVLGRVGVLGERVLGWLGVCFIELALCLESSNDLVVVRLMGVGMLGDVGVETVSLVVEHTEQLQGGGQGSGTSLE